MNKGESSLTNRYPGPDEVYLSDFKRFMELSNESEEILSEFGEPFDIDKHRFELGERAHRCFLNGVAAKFLFADFSCRIVRALGDRTTLFDWEDYGPLIGSTSHAVAGMLLASFYDLLNDNASEAIDIELSEGRPLPPTPMGEWRTLGPFWKEYFSDSERYFAESLNPKELMLLQMKIRNERIMYARGFEHDTEPPGQQSIGKEVSPVESIHTATVANTSRGGVDPKPKWSVDDRMLSFNGQITRQFSPQTGNDVLNIISTFEECDWPSRIDDPLSPPDSEKTKLALRTINTGIQGLRFSKDKDGIKWEVIRN